MTEYIPVEGKIGLYRDSDSTAIINRDKKAYLDYMKRKKIAKAKNSELDKMKEDINNCKLYTSPRQRDISKSSMPS